MLRQFLEQYFKSSFYLSADKFVARICALLLMPTLVSLGLFISVNVAADYDATMDVYTDPEHVDIKFTGQPPKSLGGFNQYTIEKFELKIGSVNRYSVTKHADTILYAYVNNIEDLNYGVDQWPSSYLVLTWDLSFPQAISEAFKCWWSPAYLNCAAKVWSAYAYNQTDSIDITSALKKAVEQEIGTLGRTIDDLKPDLIENLYETPSIYFHFPHWYPEEKRTDTVVTAAQSRLVFGFATIDYLTQHTTFSETIDKITLINNLTINLKTDGSVISKVKSWYEGMAPEFFKAFSSMDCINQLSHKTIYNIRATQRLLLRAKDYAEHVCQLNQISFAKNNKLHNPNAAEYHDSEIDAVNSVFKPYVFCDAYTCQFNQSVTHQYRLIDNNFSSLAIGYKNMRMIYEYFYPDTKWDSGKQLCNKSCTFPIDDQDGLNNILDKLKNFVSKDWREASWAFIEIDD